MSAEEHDLRATLEGAFDEVEQASTDGTNEDTAQPLRTTEEAAPAPAAASDKQPTIDKDGRARVNGRFAPKAAAAPVAAPDGAPAASSKVEGLANPAALPANPATPADGKPDPFAKAPQSWKPGAREAWHSLTPEVRAEVHRREREAQQIVQQSAQARQISEHMSQLQQRFAPALQAEGVDVFKATQNLMDLSTRLRFGTPMEKAALGAHIIKAYGIDVNALADALDGQQQPGAAQGQQAPQQYRDPRVDQLFTRLEQGKRQREERASREAATRVTSFGEGKDFFNDVREDMADMMDLAARRGLELTLEQAYERACRFNPEIAKILDARQAAAAAGNSNQSTQRARIAASSVRGTPSSVPSSQPVDLRSTIEDAITQVGER